MRIRGLKLALGATALFCGLIGQAQATLMLVEGNIAGDTDNVLFNACDNEVLGPALTVSGCLNTNHATVVDFTGTEDLLANGGQATIEGADGLFDAVTINLADPSLGFAKLIFNLDAVADGTADFRAVDQFGNVFNFADIVLDGEGENFFTLLSDDNQIAVSFSLLSTDGPQNIVNLQQVRLGAVEIPQQIPEPGSLALIGVGLLGIAGLARRRKSEL